MEFDESRVYTALNADELKPGDKVYLGDTIAELKYKLENEDYSPSILTIIDIDDWNFSFVTKKDVGNLAYLVERTKRKEFRPYKDCDEMLADFKKRFNANWAEYELPLIWIKAKDADKKYLIVRLASALTICHNVEVYTPTWVDLVEGYTYLDGSPCGMKE